MSSNSLGARATFKVGNKEYELYRLDALDKQGISTRHLPFSLRILLENLLRTEDGRNVTKGEIRALAARELGGFEKPELLPLLASAARDPQLIVGVNAIEGLANYRDVAVVPYLLEIAKGGGLIGAAAVDRALSFRDPRLPGLARVLLAGNGISDKLAAMRVLSEMGDTNDIPALQEIARKETEMVSAGRGFGLMPSISLSRAAKTTIERIESRYPPKNKDADQ